jgi:L-methionine (R)-S-oxide reductase
MFEAKKYNGSRTEQYSLLIKQLNALLTGEKDRIANLANASALLNQFLEDVNWVGFYLYDGKELVLGPFQGLPACVRIPVGKGVCGSSAEKLETFLVEDVHQFPGHIACDAATCSEIVIPIVINRKLVGVLDIDSPSLNRFDEVDKHYLEQFVEELTSHL